MVGDPGRRDEGNRDIESIVNGAMGQSVTPSRLHESSSIGLFRRLIGNAPVEGPFTDDLDSGEQPHYLLHSTNLLSFPQEEDEFQDDLFTILNESIISPVVLMVTDERSLFIYGNGDRRRVVSVPHEDVVDVEYTDMKVEKELSIRTTQRRLDFGMWATDPYDAETSDAAAYIFEQSDTEGGYQKYDFNTGDYSAARLSLQEQLKSIQGISDQVDLEYVASCAVKGAKIGGYRSPYAAGIGFMLGAGYGIWSDLDSMGQGSDLVEQVDPERTAEVMLR